MENNYLEDNLADVMIVIQKLHDLHAVSKKDNYIRYVLYDLFNSKKTAVMNQIKEDEILYFLNNINLVNIDSLDKEYDTIETEEGTTEIVNKVFYIKIPDNFENSFKKIMDLNRNKIQKLFFKQNDKYYFKGDLLELNTKTKYYAIFDIIFMHSDKNGFISYDDIVSRLRLRGVKNDNDKEKNRKSINNAVINENQGFFRKAKINGKRISNQTPDQKPIMKAIKGEGVEFNNPDLN